MIQYFVFLIVCGIVLGYFSAFIITLMYKWGVVEYMQLHGNEFVNRLFSCNFCMSFWVSLFLAVIGALFYGEWIIIPSVIIATLKSKNLL